MMGGAADSAGRAAKIFKSSAAFQMATGLVTFQFQER